LDVGKFNGLYEATDIKLQVQALDQQGALRGEEKSAAILAGPTCDSDDLLSPLTDAHQVSVDVDVQDYMLFPGTGAYSNSYTTMKFNGFNPLDEYYI
jgi:ornithine decarboxylase